MVPDAGRGGWAPWRDTTKDRSDDRSSTQEPSSRLGLGLIDERLEHLERSSLGSRVAKPWFAGLSETRARFPSVHGLSRFVLGAHRAGRIRGTGDADWQTNCR